MTKKKLQLRELAEQKAKLGLEIDNLLDAVEARENKWTDEEKAKYDALQLQMRSLDGRIMAAEANNGSINISRREAEFSKSLRELCNANKREGVKLEREWTAGVDTTAAANTVPLTIMDIVKPLEEGMVLNKVGIPLRTGLAGAFQWPVLGSVEAKIAGEKIKLDDSTVSISKIKPNAVRFGISFPITNQAINQTDGLAFDIVKEQATLGLMRALNRVMFCTEQINSDFKGPFLNAKVKGTFKKAVPSYKELLKMKADVLKAGVENGGTGCFIMSETMKAELEATPVDAGSGKMVVENDRIGGYPIFCTNYINYGSDSVATEVENVGFGVFAYQPLGGFGEMRLIVDPYSMADMDCVKVTLNSDWATATLRAEAFGWMKCGVGE